jgi:hypothetical protein
MPRFDHRFARQNGFGPPPEFPLASSYPGIVHHLSGPNTHARSISLASCRPVLPVHVTFIAHPGLPPSYSHACWTPWSVFQDGSLGDDLRCCCDAGTPALPRPWPGPQCASGTATAIQRTSASHCEISNVAADRARLQDSPGPIHHPTPPIPHQPSPSASLLTISRTFHPLFKVLFIFPSRYLFAIGLLPLFSLG